MERIDNLLVTFEYLNCLIDVVEKNGISKDIAQSFDPEGKMITQGYFESYDYLPDIITQGDAAQEFIEVIVVVMGIIITAIVVTLTTKTAKFERMRNKYIKETYRLKHDLLNAEHLIKRFDNLEDIKDLFNKGLVMTNLSKKDFVLLTDYIPKLCSICKKDLLILFEKCENIIRNNIIASDKDFYDEYIHFFNTTKNINNQYLNDNIGINIRIIDNSLSIVSDAVNNGKYSEKYNNDEESYENLGWDVSDFKMIFDFSNKALSHIVGFENIINSYIKTNKAIINALKVNFSKKASKAELLEYKKSLEAFNALIDDMQFFLNTPLTCTDQIVEFTSEFISDIHICVHA